MSDKQSTELRNIDAFGYENYRLLLDLIYNAGMSHEDHYRLKDNVDRYIETLLERRLEAAKNEARIHENQMGLQLHLAIKNGLEQESENAQLTATWKANEQIIKEFEVRINQLTNLRGRWRQV